MSKHTDAPIEVKARFVTEPYIGPVYDFSSFRFQVVCKPNCPICQVMNEHGDV
jgi:hypothetical protein